MTTVLAQGCFQIRCLYLALLTRTRHCSYIRQCCSKMCPVYLFSNHKKWWSATLVARYLICCTSQWRSVNWFRQCQTPFEPHVRMVTLDNPMQSVGVTALALLKSRLSYSRLSHSRLSVQNHMRCTGLVTTRIPSSLYKLISGSCKG